MKTNLELYSKLTKHQKNIAGYIPGGYTDSDIAQELDISVNTVKAHLKNIRHILCVANRAEMAGYIASVTNQNIEGRYCHNITGLWLSWFEIELVTESISSEASLIHGAQFSIERIIASPFDFFDFEGDNIAKTSDINANARTHHFKGKMIDNRIQGLWNDCNTSELGCFQLHISNNSKKMSGVYTSTTEGKEVFVGKWKWLKISTTEPGDLQQEIRLCDFCKLNEIFEYNLRQNSELTRQEICSLS